MTKLLVRLLAPPVASAQIVAFACAALSNLCADLNAAAAFGPDERAKLLDSLPALTTSPEHAASQVAAEESLQNLKTIDGYSDKERQRMLNLAKKRMKGGACSFLPRRTYCDRT